MSDHHGGQSMSHPIITLYLVWCIPHSNSWSSPLVLTNDSMDIESMFQFLLRILEKQIYRSLASGLRKLSYGKNIVACRSFSLPPLVLCIFFMILSILAQVDNVLVFIEACQQDTCLGLNKDENR
jgi:hypothetical protein